MTQQPRKRPRPSPVEARHEEVVRQEELLAQLLAYAERLCEQRHEYERCMACTETMAISVVRDSLAVCFECECIRHWAAARRRAKRRAERERDAD